MHISNRIMQAAIAATAATLIATAVQAETIYMPIVAAPGTISHIERPPVAIGPGPEVAPMPVITTTITPTYTEPVIVITPTATPEPSATPSPTVTVIVTATVVVTPEATTATPEPGKLYNMPTTSETLAPQYFWYEADSTGYCFNGWLFHMTPADANATMTQCMTQHQQQPVDDSEAVANYWNAVLESGDCLNDWLTHMTSREYTEHGISCMSRYN